HLARVLECVDFLPGRKPARCVVQPEEHGQHSELDEAMTGALNHGVPRDELLSWLHSRLLPSRRTAVGCGEGGPAARSHPYAYGRGYGLATALRPGPPLSGRTG